MFAALVVCRFVHYGAVMLLFGASIFLWVLAPAALTVRLERHARRLTRGPLAAIVLTTVVWLCLEAGSMGEGWHDTVRPATVLAVLTETDFGAAWQVHSLACLCLVAAWLARRVRLVCIASGFALASLGLIGHAAMHNDLLGWLHRANLALHLTAGGFWLGGLVPMLAAMRLASQPALRTAVILALRRFSMLGHGAVAAVILTGTINTLLVLGPGAIFNAAPTYRALLFTKVAVVAAMVGLALVNRYWLVPRLRQNSGATGLLIRNSCFEIGLGGLAIALVSVFGLLDPYI